MKTAKERLLNYKPKKAKISRTLFGEIIEADPKIVVENANDLAKILKEYFKNVSTYFIR